MGRNSDIKRFEAAAAGQPLELFDSARARLPVIVELLSSPWIVRASELVRESGSLATKRAEEPVDVEWDRERQRPLSFVRGSRRFVVDAVIQAWVTERSWWDPRSRVSRRFYRVLSREGVYDLAYDRSGGKWTLIGIQD